jgi:hypothetical protein
VKTMGERKELELDLPESGEITEIKPVAYDPSGQTMAVMGWTPDDKPSNESPKKLPAVDEKGACIIYPGNPLATALASGPPTRSPVRTKLTPITISMEKHEMVVEELNAKVVALEESNNHLLDLAEADRKRIEKITKSVVLQEWVWSLPWRQQSVLLCSLRGCDGLTKNDPSKFIVRNIRAVVLKDADPRNAFISRRTPLHEAVRLVAEDVDKYHVHFLMHMMHAAEIIGFKHPDGDVAQTWLDAYERLCAALHVNSEGALDLEERLGATEIG